MAGTDVTVHPKLTCPDCGGERDARAKRCISCHLARKRKPIPTCIDCGITITRGASPRCRSCSALARRGRRLRRDGYVQVLRPGHPLARRDGYVSEHRLVLYEAGVAIPPDHHVHHINGNRADNRIENLEVIRPADHGRLHSPNTGKTHCANGHAFDAANTFIDKNGWRRCRACNRERQRVRNARLALDAVRAASLRVRAEVAR